MKRHIQKICLAIAIVMAFSLMLGACASSGQTASSQQPSDSVQPATASASTQASAQASASDTSKSLAGQEITVLLPPWYQEGLEATIPDFEKETGIKVNLQILDWEPLMDKIVTSCSAGTAPADVTEFSWDWTGTYYKAGWYEPLNDYFPSTMWDDILSKKAFSYEGKYMAVPIYNDFRLTYVDTADFTAAGIKDIPNTADGMLEAARAIKKAGVSKYPIMLPLSATSATTTPWFMLTKAYGGELFDANWNPLFLAKDSAGYKAMSWVINAYKEGLVNPAALDYKGTDVVDHFKNGDGSIDIAGWAGNVTEYTKDDSKIAKTVKVIQVPGTETASRTYGLQEGVGIPSASTHKEAAVAFIKWINQEPFMEKFFTDYGIFPNHASTIKALTEANKMPQGETVSKAMETIEPLFPQGAPSWYSSWETDVSTYMNQIAKGEMTMDKGLQAIADSAAKLKAAAK
ncbi:MAG: extracellular solute-binding protein [Eubacteriales bacterium]